MRLCTVRVAGTPLTASWSEGRSEYYAYSHSASDVAAANVSRIPATHRVRGSRTVVLRTLDLIRRVVWLLKGNPPLVQPRFPKLA
jgi:hypothetical protein